MPINTSPRKQTIYRGVDISSTASPTGDRAIVIDIGDEQLIFPLTAEGAELIGKGLAAPHVHIPSNGNGSGVR